MSDFCGALGDQFTDIELGSLNWDSETNDDDQSPVVRDYQECAEVHFMALEYLIKKSFDRIDGYDHGWNGADSMPVDANARDCTIDFLRQAFNTSSRLPLPSIALEDDGMVSVFWEREGLLVDALVDADGTIGYSAINRGTLLPSKTDMGIQLATEEILGLFQLERT